MTDSAGDRGIRFLLIHPRSVWRRKFGGGMRPTDRFFDYSMLPCLYVAASTPSDVRVEIVNEDYGEVDFGADVDIVGVSIMSMNAPRAYEIAAAFRGRGVPVIAGGFHATLCPEEVQEHFDAVCVGDCERAVPRMIDDYKSGRLGGLYRDPVVDLGALPKLDRRLYRGSSLFQIEGVQATRGCPQCCDYCSVTAFHRQTFRTRPVAEVAEELGSMGKRVLFTDDNLTASRDYALDLFSAIAPLGRRWFGQCSLGMAFDEELLVAAAASGCRGMFIGLETLSEANLKSSRKEFNLPGRYAKAVESFHEHGIAVFAGIVFGMDDDRPDVFEETFAFLEESGVDLVAANVMTPFPGTPLHARLKVQGRIFDDDLSRYDMNNVVFEPAQMSPEVLKRGTCWVRSKFYSGRRITGRIRRALRYLDLDTTLKVLLPINLGFHSRLNRGPARGHAAAFVASRSSAADA